MSTYTLADPPTVDYAITTHRLTWLTYRADDPAMRAWLAASAFDPDSIEDGAPITVRAGTYLHVGDVAHPLAQPVPAHLDTTAQHLIEAEAQRPDGSRWYERVELTGDNPDAAATKATNRVRDVVELYHTPPCAIPDVKHSNAGRGTFLYTPAEDGTYEGHPCVGGEPMRLCSLHLVQLVTG